MTYVIVIGCGVIGAALAYRLSQYKLKVLVLEKQNDVAMGATRANSAIIHAGFDPESGTLMAKLNVQGSNMARTLCEKLSVPYLNNGALVLGFDKEEADALVEAGAERVWLGKRILRCETAPITALSILMFLTNNM